MSTVVRAPASSANLGAGFDVLGMALGVHADVGTGDAPDGATVVDDAHPARVPFERLGGRGPLWMRSSIPMARGLGFSGAVRVAAAALGVVTRGGRIDAAEDAIFEVAAQLEGHGDNAAASVHGGVVAYTATAVHPLRLGPTLAASRVVAWIPSVTTSTDQSRRKLDPLVARPNAVFNLGRVVQLTLAIERDDPDLLRGATEDRLHQAVRLPLVPGAADALEAGLQAGAWCGWLSGSGPTVVFLAPEADASDVAARVLAASDTAAHTKVLEIDPTGVHVIDPDDAA